MCCSLALNKATLHGRVHTVWCRVEEEQRRQRELQTTVHLLLEDLQDRKHLLSQRRQELTLLRLSVPLALPLCHWLCLSAASSASLPLFLSFNSL